MTTLDSRVVLTRKPHTCWGCLHKFPAGSILERYTGVNEDGIGTSYLCQDCYHELSEWDYRDAEEVTNGEVGYWKDGQWYPANFYGATA